MSQTIDKSQLRYELHSFYSATILVCNSVDSSTMWQIAKLGWTRVGVSHSFFSVM